MQFTVDQSLLAQAATVPLQVIHWPRMEAHGIQVIVRRDDLIHPQLSGNKFYKLHHNLMEAKRQGHDTILSFGGAWSNHLYALAAAGKIHGIKTLGIVRGEPQPTAMLKDAQNFGMKLKYWTREQFRQNKGEHIDSGLFDELLKEFGRFYTIPEGGSNVLGAKGCAAISMATELALNGNFSDICVACGTGATLAGVAAGLSADKTAWGLSVLKGQGSMAQEVADLVDTLCGKNSRQWHLVKGHHGGGYAKLKPELRSFMLNFEAQTGLLLDPIYTAKLFAGIETMAAEGVWKAGSRLVIVHSGGLQGRRGFEGLTPEAENVSLEY